MIRRDAKVWLPYFPWPTKDSHKYTRGHALVIGGPLQKSGAAKLAAIAALRTAAGLVTLLVPQEDDLKVYIASSNTCALLHNTYDKISEYLNDKNVSSIIVGPGFGEGEIQDDILDKIISSDKALLLDADALQKPRQNSNSIITPHEGEFARLFPDMAGTRAERAKRAAEITGSIVVLKGNQTIIAAPDGRIYVNDAATPWLATAGSGDTLSGIIGGLLAAKMPAFEAAIAGVHIHSRAGELAGPGLIADDLAGEIPEVLKEIIAST